MTSENLIILALFLITISYLLKVILHFLYLKKSNLYQTKLFFSNFSIATIISFVPIPLFNSSGEKHKLMFYGNIFLLLFYLTFIVAFIYVSANST